MWGGALLVIAGFVLTAHGRIHLGLLVVIGGLFRTFRTAFARRRGR